VPARAVPAEDGGAGLARRPAVTPCADREQDVGQLPALLGQLVLVPRWSLRVEPLLEHSLCDEPFEAPSEHPARDAKVALDLIEAAVDDIDAAATTVRARGGELVGEVENYEDIYRLCYVRGPEGIIVELAERIGRGLRLRPTTKIATHVAVMTSHP
jgi:catechol 2,3-dioxygenase-like lactoylglutathione lyase family enzyme